MGSGASRVPLPSFILKEQSSAAVPGAIHSQLIFAPQSSGAKAASHSFRFFLPSLSRFAA